MKPCSKFSGEGRLGRCSVLGVGVNSEVVCAACQQHWVNDAPPEQKDDNKYLLNLVREKTFGERLVSIGTALLGGVRLASQKKIDERAGICGRCELLVDDGRIYGKVCKACGCSVLKMQFEAMVCPLGKW